VSTAATRPPSESKALRDDAILDNKETAKTRYPTYAVPPGRRHFWLRRVHSLFGLAFGGYITVHLLVNATGVNPWAYQQNVDKIHSLEPMLPLIEIVAIFIPLLVHAIYGIYIANAGVKFNTTKYNYGGNLRYTLQRWTSWFLLLFIAYHIGTLHKWGLALFGVEGYPKFNPANAAYETTVTAVRVPYTNMGLNVAVSILYLLGTWSAVFHWANGLWTSAIAWGLTVTRNSQQRWGHFCFGFGIVMMLVGTTAWAAFAFGDPNFETPTMPAARAQEVHAQASSGKETLHPNPAGVNPGTQMAPMRVPTTAPMNPPPARPGRH